MMADREFPLKDLEQELRNISNESAESAMITGSGGSSVAESPVDVLKRTAKADIIMMLTQDEIMAEVYREEIEPYMTEGQDLSFAQGKTSTVIFAVDVFETETSRARYSPF